MEAAFSNSNPLDGSDMLTSRVVVLSDLLIPASLPDFKIEKGNYFKQLVSSNAVLKVSTTDERFKKQLQQSARIQSFFAFFKSDPEFEPNIVSKSHPEGTQLQIRFQCRALDGRYLELLTSLHEELFRLSNRESL